jgi:GT2 family glycosyltransferase
MIHTIDCFIPFAGAEHAAETVGELRASGIAGAICLLTTETNGQSISGCEIKTVAALNAGETIRFIAHRSQADYTLLYTRYTTLRLGQFALQRLVNVARDARAGMVYADHYQITENGRTPKPLIDYQPGSLRDDFDFGPLLLFRTAALKEAAARVNPAYRFAGLYDLRLKLSQKEPLTHVNEYLYTNEGNNVRKSGEKLFDYVDPKNRSLQLEMEQACTGHLKETGAWLPPIFEPVAFDNDDYDCEASIIIPVRNRIRTIEDAIRSALSQQTSFRFNVIVVDNHSTDGTSRIIETFASDRRLVHIIPDRQDLGIGGCWNVAVHHPTCGKFAVQLDSDDVYKDENTLQIMVDAFYEQNCAMVVGTYLMTDFNLRPIPPGVIDHREWTPENGRNNALRVNGFGAPRAFYTRVLREINFPNTNYGEDYALGLNFSRRYRIGRVYDVVYLCRRWEDNSDASPDIAKINEYNTYKDRIRSWELSARTTKRQKG